MRYLIDDNEEPLLAVRAACRQAAGIPYIVPGLPGPSEYDPNAINWTHQLILPPRQMQGGGWLLDMPSDVDPYLGQTVTGVAYEHGGTDNLTVTIPAAEQLLEFEQLPQEYQDEINNPPGDVGSPPPEPEPEVGP